MAIAPWPVPSPTLSGSTVSRHQKPTDCTPGNCLRRSATGGWCDVLGLCAASDPPRAPGTALLRAGRVHDVSAPTSRPSCQRCARKVAPPALFPGYAFVLIELQWHSATKTPGVIRLVLDGARPAKVEDKIIDDLKRRERNGLIELSAPPGFQHGDPVRVRGGPLTGYFGLYQGRRGADRIAILMSWLGSERVVVMPAGHIAAEATSGRDRNGTGKN